MYIIRCRLNLESAKVPFLVNVLIMYLYIGFTWAIQFNALILRLPYEPFPQLEI